MANLFAPTAENHTDLLPKEGPNAADNAAAEVGFMPQTAAVSDDPLSDGPDEDDSPGRLPLIIVAGPTAVGKSAAAVLLAKRIGGEIISADSMQVYKGMDIGTAKITPEEMGGVPHHLIDILDPSEEFNVVRFQQLAKEALAQIYGRGHIPVVVGGTGFYIQALLYDIDFTETEADSAFRARMEQLAEEKGDEELHDMLRAVDPQAAEELHPHNRKRVIRALEFYRQTGKRISAHNEQQRQRKSPYCFAYFVLTDDRQEIYRRIDARVDRMMADGLLAETKRLQEKGIPRTAVSMQGLGYRELCGYLDGEYPLSEAVRLIKRNTRHFAKRQLTWFKREREVIWADKRTIGRDDAAAAEFMASVLHEDMPEISLQH